MRRVILARWAQELATASLEDPAACDACQEVAETSKQLAWHVAIAMGCFSHARAASACGVATLQQHFSSFTDMQAAVLAQRQTAAQQPA